MNKLFMFLAIASLNAYATEESISCDTATTWQYFPRGGAPQAPVVSIEKLTAQRSSHYEGNVNVLDTTGEVREDGTLLRSYVTNRRTTTQAIGGDRIREFSDVHQETTINGQTSVDNFSTVTDVQIQGDGQRKILRVVRNNVDITMVGHNSSMMTSDGKRIETYEDDTVRIFPDGMGSNREFLSKQVCIVTIQQDQRTQ